LLRTLAIGVLGTALAIIPLHQAAAWGDEGHEVVALIARAYLQPDVRKQVDAMLAADTDPLTAHDIASEATWADKLRDSNEGGARERTRQWHFVDIEIAAPDLDSACSGHPRIPTGKPASLGVPADCVVDKIQEFAAELNGPTTNPEERLVALKFVLHFVGDLHQPLHAADANDRGGNDKHVSAKGFKAGNLHHFWDTAFVERLGSDARTMTSELLGRMTDDQVKAWSQGSVSDWAMDTFRVAREDA
jgi:hypothetical protein